MNKAVFLCKTTGEMNTNEPQNLVLRNFVSTFFQKVPHGFTTSLSCVFGIKRIKSINGAEARHVPMSEHRIKIIPVSLVVSSFLALFRKMNWYSIYTLLSLRWFRSVVMMEHTVTHFIFLIVSESLVQKNTEWESCLFFLFFKCHESSVWDWKITSLAELVSNDLCLVTFLVMIVCKVLCVLLNSLTAKTNKQKKKKVRETLRFQSVSVVTGGEDRGALVFSPAAGSPGGGGGRSCIGPMVCICYPLFFICVVFFRPGPWRQRTRRRPAPSPATGRRPWWRPPSPPRAAPPSCTQTHKHTPASVGEGK